MRVHLTQIRLEYAVRRIFGCLRVRWMSPRLNAHRYPVETMRSPALPGTSHLSTQPAQDQLPKSLIPLHVEVVADLRLLSVVDVFHDVCDFIGALQGDGEAPIELGVVPVHFG